MNCVDFYRCVVHHRAPWLYVHGLFFFKEVTWSNIFHFFFSGFSTIVPYVTLEVVVHLLRLRFLGEPMLAHFACPWYSLVSIL